VANLNRIILIGCLTQDPEVRFTVDGSPMAKFNLTVNRFGGVASGTDAADFIDIIAWGKLAEVCGEFLKKGSLCLVEGRIQVRQFDTEGGKRKYATEVVARNMQRLESKKEGEATSRPAAASAGQSHAAPAAVDDDEIFEAPDDLPF